MWNREDVDRTRRCLLLLALALPPPPPPRLRPTPPPAPLVAAREPSVYGEMGREEGLPDSPLYSEREHEGEMEPMLVALREQDDRHSGGGSESTERGGAALESERADVPVEEGSDDSVRTVSGREGIGTREAPAGPVEGEMEVETELAKEETEAPGSPRPTPPGGAEKREASVSAWE